MKISIITATYNSAETIKDCLQSVVEQDYSEIEYVIIDGESTDKTLEIIKEYGRDYEFIKYISEKDNGIYDALNKGINMATGEIIGFVHSDDLLSSKDIISKIALAFKEKQIDGLYGNLKYVKFNDINKVLRNWVSKSFDKSLLNNGWMPAHPTLYLKREVYNKHGSFNIDFQIAADYDFILRVFKDSAFKFYYLPQVIYIMRTGGASNKSISNIIKKTKEDIKALRLNQVKLPFLVVMKKNFTKIPQWFSKK